MYSCSRICEYICTVHIYVYVYVKKDGDEEEQKTKRQEEGMAEGRGKLDDLPALSSHVKPALKGAGTNSMPGLLCHIHASPDWIAPDDISSLW